MTADRQPTARTRRSEPFPGFQDRTLEAGLKREAVVTSLAPSADVVSARSAKESQARASRRNGARSRGPKTAAGKARAARNALSHGLRARKLVLLDDEDAAEFRAFTRALQAELMPEGRLQTDLVGRIVMAAWRARRADRLEAGVLGSYLDAGGAERLGTELIRDSQGPRALATLVRYRGSVLAEMFRSLAALKHLQAGASAAPATAHARLPSPPVAATERT